MTESHGSPATLMTQTHPKAEPTASRVRSLVPRRPCRLILTRWMGGRCCDTSETRAGSARSREGGLYRSGAMCGARIHCVLKHSWISCIEPFATGWGSVASCYLGPPDPWSRNIASGLRKTAPVSCLSPCKGFTHSIQPRQLSRPTTMASES
ncbi:uncharacterized protein BO80DRAFT_153711 [Aspergillus ibericus CBS 121593]|uniref:Uncharacterized protein n=1 Tax=Aspergillus ibericus CBS 121593 TaxID=1448316 RepID=A0A395GSN6_9EURO|nr:hypothetical protein BO80DRAFT_153711 [Aspergillus ibericus CBS 121593]RAK98601.1 hypothetical protein BO80DRAFT_153711 [Aspergillus ibericus CBS 121593]